PEEESDTDVRQKPSSSVSEQSAAAIVTDEQKKMLLQQALHLEAQRRKSQRDHSTGADAKVAKPALSAQSSVRQQQSKKMCVVTFGYQAAAAEQLTVTGG